MKRQVASAVVGVLIIVLAVAAATMHPPPAAGKAGGAVPEPARPAVGQDDAKAIQGVWVAASMEANGKPAPAEAVKVMRFTFKADTLLIRGNFRDEREEEFTFKLDAASSPKHLDIIPADKDKEKGQVTILGIYELKGDDLKVCIRHAKSDKGRPAEFATTPDSELVLVVFKREPAKDAAPPKKPAP
jgi:uncharacterized protein (TIGR03067 family)